MEKHNLNTLLATTAVFAQKISNLHWNIKDKNFMEIHKMTDKLYEQIYDFIDKLAEKIKMQNKFPFSTMQEFLNHSLIKEIEVKDFKYDEVIDIICSDLNIYADLAKNTETDFWIQPLLDEISIVIDKEKWFFNSSKAN